MALGQPALCKRAVQLELKELNTIRLSPEFVFALEACLLDIYGILRPRPDDYVQREVLVQAFNRMVKDAYGTHGKFPVVEAFGSFIMDLFTVGSDLDLSINFSNDNSTEFPRDKKISVLRKLTRFLYKVQREGGISKIMPILRARVPVVKVVDSRTGIECDISAENKDGVSRSSFFTIVSSIDRRFQILCYLMKAWAKAHDINSSKDRTMNSLSIISLVAFHLQTRDPPILPPFSALLKDGTDISSIQKVVVGFEHFGRRNEECIAKLFITLLIKLSSVESLWPQGLCASPFEGSWIKKEWETGIGYMSIEDFLDPSQNFARCVGKDEMKKINNCIKGSRKLLSRLMEGEIGEIKLKERLFGLFALNVSSDHLTGEQMGLKRPIPLHEHDLVNSITTKRVRYTEGIKDLRHEFHLTPTNWSNTSIHLNPPASFQTREQHIKSFERYQLQPPIPPPTNWPSLSIPLNPLPPFQPSFMEDHVRPFEISQLGHRPQYPQSSIPSQLGSQYHPQPPISHISAFGSRYKQQPPIPSNLGYGSNYHLQPPISAHLGHYQPDRNLQLPGITDDRRENPWRGYSAQDLGRRENPFVHQQFNLPDYRFPPFPHL